MRTVTVLTRQDDSSNFGATPITVAELGQLVNGEKPVELFGRSTPAPGFA